MSFLFNDINRLYQQESNQLVITDDVYAIEQNIDNILECPVGSFMFNRGFGSRLRSFLFEPMNEQTAMAIKIYLIQAVERWEPRIFVIMSQTWVIPDYDNNTYFVRITYQVKTSGAIEKYIRTLPTQTGQ